MIKSIDTTGWKEFLIKDIVVLEENKSKPQVPTGSNVSKTILKSGNIPRITVTSYNNGVDNFYLQEPNYTREYENFISISFLGNAFYHPYRATTDMKVHTFQLKNRKLNRYIALFIITALKNNTKNSSYGYQLSSTDLPLKKVLLPVDSKGEPDYKFMEEYIKERETRLKNKYKEHIKSLVDKLHKEVCINKEWQDFYISKIFEIKAGKRLTKANMKSGDIPFIGATDNGNGITNYVSNINSSLDSNVLGVNYDGNGVAISFYHPYQCLFTDSVKRFHLLNHQDNKYVLLFMKIMILKQKQKYMYGYKFCESRMARQKIMLPVNSEGEPDYKFMEDYMKYLEQKKLLEYLDYIK